MEYLNQVTPHYLYSLKNNQGHYKLKLEILSSFEQALGEIIKDISITAQGQININYQQLTRRSCTLTLINVDKKYTPDQNRWFWINRKFKLWIGLQNNDDVYWFSQGVYYAQSVSGDSHVLNIQGIDKGGALDGTLKLNMSDCKYIVETGSTISDLVRHTLQINDGANILDPIKPLIDMDFNKVIIETETSINQGEYIGALLSDIATSYSADIYYDTDGRLRFHKLCDGQRVDGYNYMGIDYWFDDGNARYSASTLDYSYDCINSVTVYTNISVQDSDGNTVENVSYTAYNKNPKSPLNIFAVGIRRMEAVEVKYIAKLSHDEMTERCRQTAEYYLLQNSMQNLSISFNSNIIPHLDVNKVVAITDKAKELESERFVIKSITIPLSAGEMNIQATSIDMLSCDSNIGMW